MDNLQPNILVVDDDEETLDIMRLYLNDIAHVITASNGKEALQYVQTEQIDILLLDIAMPIMDGFKTLEKFRNLKESINVPVVFVTGKTDKVTIMNSALMGVDGYMVKPVEKESLQKKVMEAWREREIRENKKTVLAIDDDMAYLKLINNYLSEHYNVIMINSAKLAINYLSEHVPDLILLDYKMPLYNGANVLSVIQKSEETQRVPVILLSGVIDKEVLRDCLPYNPAAYLAKPVTKEFLLENIKKALDQ